jgi:dimethylhistidine N-methyltransferase
LSSATADTLLEEVVRGLSGSPPRLPAKLLYDEVGAGLFEEITGLPEYYPTRTEIGILEAHLPEIARMAGPGLSVVEFGSGSGEKTELLLRALDRPAAYIPVDISREQLARVADTLDRRFPGLRVVPLSADYTRPFCLPTVDGLPDDDATRVLLFFPGSTIGNFDPPAARDFLRRAGESLGPGAALLLGVDLTKGPEVLLPAYDDARGVTAAFNRNVLAHVNRLLGTDFQPESFRHRAVWNERASRIEMHLVAEEAQRVAVPATSNGKGKGSERPGARLRLELRPGDHIVTEHSYKYTLPGLADLTAAAGWATRATWTDRRKWFAVQFLERSDNP